jgi:hypothetical protein
MDKSKDNNVVSRVVYDNIPNQLSGVNFSPELKPEHIQKLKQETEEALQELSNVDLDNTLNNLFDFKSLKMEGNGLYSVDINEIEERNLSKLFNENDIENDRLNLSTESLKNIDGNRLLQIVKEFAHDASKFSSDALDTIVDVMEDSMSNSEFSELIDRVMENNTKSNIDFSNDDNQNALVEIENNMQLIEEKKNRQAMQPAISQKARGMNNG